MMKEVFDCSSLIYERFLLIFVQQDLNELHLLHDHDQKVHEYQIALYQ